MISSTSTTFQGCDIIGNSAEQGGAIWDSDSIILFLLDDCRMYAMTFPSCSYSCNTIRFYNYATGSGGVVALIKGTITITNSQVYLLSLSFFFSLSLLLFHSFSSFSLFSFSLFFSLSLFLFLFSLLERNTHPYS